jgi:hypothetical protein
MSRESLILTNDPQPMASPMLSGSTCTVYGANTLGVLLLLLLLLLLSRVYSYSSTYWYRCNVLRCSFYPYATSYFTGYPTFTVLE